MGFCLCSLGVLVLIILIAIYNNWFVEKFEDLEELYDKIAGYGNSSLKIYIRENYFNFFMFKNLH